MPPTDAAETAHHGVVRGCGQNGKADPGGKPDRQVIAQHDFGNDLAEVEHLIGDVEHQVQRDVEERGYPDHAADIDQLRVAPDPPQRRNKERQQHETQRPQPHFVDSLGARARSELMGCREIQKGEEWRDKKRQSHGSER